METSEITIWSKFDADILNFMRRRGGSPISILFDLKNIKAFGEVYFYHFGLVKYINLKNHISGHDLKILDLIKKEYSINF